MLHRDISVNNIMYEKRGDNYYHFILIDFDMAVVLPKDESTYVASSKHRTGTPPFMALELVFDAWKSSKKGRHWTPKKHLLRHDFESLFWVSLWCVLALLKNGLSNSEVDELLGYVKSWEAGDLDDIAGRKLFICINGLEEFGIDLPPAAACLRRWFKAWTKLLLEASTITGTCLQKNFSDKDTDDDNGSSKADWETAKGKLTKEELQRVLMKAFPIPEQYLSDPEPDVTDLQTDDDDIPANEDIPMATKPRRQVRKRTRPIPPPVPVEDDIRSRLRPRKPRVYT